MPSDAPSVDEGQPVTLAQALEREAIANPVLPLDAAVRAADGSRAVKVIEDRKKRTQSLLLGLGVEAGKTSPGSLADHLHQPRATGKR